MFVVYQHFLNHADCVVSNTIVKVNDEYGRLREKTTVANFQVDYYPEFSWSKEYPDSRTRKNSKQSIVIFRNKTVRQLGF
jgi:hypothetical protein